MSLHLHPNRRTVRIAAYLALVALALMTWPLFDARPLPIVIAMSVGQLLGTISFGLFLAVVVTDLFRKRVLSDDPKDATFSSIPAPEPTRAPTRETPRDEVDDA